MKRPSHFDRLNARGFSLVELLVVIAILVIMTALLKPALASLLRGSETSLAVDQISGMVEHARATAMEMNTWVWVGMADTTALNRGEEQITIVEVASRDGSADTSEANLMALRRPVRVDHVKPRVHPEPHTLALGSSAGDFSFERELPTADGRRKIDFSSEVVAFSPRGDALVRADEIPEWIKISVGSAVNQADVLSVLLAGPTGQVVVAR